MEIANKIIGNILGKPKPRGGRKDFDGDGVPNKKDCQPRNTMRQDSAKYKQLRRYAANPNTSKADIINAFVDSGETWFAKFASDPNTRKADIINALDDEIA